MKWTGREDMYAKGLPDPRGEQMGDGHLAGHEEVVNTKTLRQTQRTWGELQGDLGRHLEFSSGEAKARAFSAVLKVMCERHAEELYELMAAYGYAEEA